MTRSAARAAGVFLCVVLPAFATAQGVQQIHEVRRIIVSGARELSARAIREAAGVDEGTPLPVPPESVSDLADRVLHKYKDEGYSFATVAAAYEPTGGVLTFTIDEGVINEVEFTGVDDRLKALFTQQFALQPGDVFNRRIARQALDVLLQQTRGAIRPGRIFETGGTFYDSRQLEGASHDRRRTFDMVSRDGERVLLVGLTEANGRFRIVPDLGEREDWFSSVDGFVPSLGMGIAVFDHKHFNHSYVSGHLSYKFASESAGYSIGFERPFFANRKLYVGGEIFDLTASDDQWQVNSLEASLAALGPRASFRDYYSRRGIQISSSFRPLERLEILGAFRSEHQEPLHVESDFSFWNDDEPFRPNRAAQDGHLNALVIGASLDSDSFARESLDATYRRHQWTTLFGETLEELQRNDYSPVWRIDWSSEISPAGAFDSDFDYSRSILSARFRKALTRHQDFGARFIRGWSTGLPPPQRLFAIGGLGSVHGYEFKSAGGNSMTLFNFEYALGWRNGFQLLGFYDAGHVPGTPWQKGVGWGIGLGSFRVEFGYPTNDIPDSQKVLVRFGRSF